jgi:hypothetical protein
MCYYDIVMRNTRQTDHLLSESPWETEGFYIWRVSVVVTLRSP